jgi:hypothetical protein
MNKLCARLEQIVNNRRQRMLAKKLPTLPHIRSTAFRAVRIDAKRGQEKQF